MIFLDFVKISVIGGKGGDGIVAFRREKYVPNGGPSGGDGGDGGSVVLEADNNLTTLQDYKYKKHNKAQDGARGQGSTKKGFQGQDIILKVPVGTIVRDAETGEILADMIVAGERCVVAQGGRGGLGNPHFATAKNRAPRVAKKGEEGEERIIELELKLLADVGLVGLPNAGKSTLLSVVSNAKPKIADYPFTTLEPNLGIVTYKELRSFVMADIPGIIEGASDGKGLGLRFLKHIERTSFLLYIISGEDNLKKTFSTLKKEVESFSASLTDKEFFIAVTKSDIVDEQILKENLKKLKTACRIDASKLAVISSVTGSGIRELIFKLGCLIEEMRERRSKEFEIGESDK